MRAFLEQYGIAIFTLIVLGFLIFTGVSSGQKIKNELNEDSEKIRGNSIADYIEKGKDYEVDWNEPEDNNVAFSLDWKRSNVYKVEKTILDYNVKKDNFETFFANSEAIVDIDCSYYKISDEPLDVNSMYYVDFLIEEKVYENGSVTFTVEDSVIANGLLTAQSFNLGASQPKLSGEADEFSAKLIKNNNSNIDEMLFLISVTTDDYAHKCGSMPNGLHLPKGTYLFSHAFVPIELYDHLIIQKVVPAVDIVDIDGITCIKVSKNTVTKEQILGKTLNYNASTITGETINESIVIDESMLSDNTGCFNLMGGLYFGSKGTYVPFAIAQNMDKVTIEIN